MSRSSMRSRNRRASWKRGTRFELSWPMQAMKFHGSRITSWVWATADLLRAPLPDVERQVRIEQSILIHAVLGIAPWIAQHPGSVHGIGEAVVGMPVDPKARKAPVDQVLGVRNEARIHQRIGKSRMDALAR